MFPLLQNINSAHIMNIVFLNTISDDVASSYVKIKDKK